MLLTFFPGDTMSGPRSPWREFIEARDALLAIVALPCYPSELLRDGPTLGPRLCERPRSRELQVKKLNEMGIFP